LLLLWPRCAGVAAMGEFCADAARLYI